MAPSDSDLIVGYEIFHEDSEDGVVDSAGMTTDLHYDWTLPDNDTEYVVFVVAFGGDLPSMHSNNITIPAVENTSSMWPIML